MAQVKIKKLDPNATIPTSGSAFAAGYDLYACLSGDGEVTIPAHHTVMVPTGIAVALRGWQRMRELGGAVTLYHVAQQPRKVFEASGVGRMVTIV